MPYPRFFALIVLICMLSAAPSWAGSAAESMHIPVNPHFFHYNSAAPLESTVTPLRDEARLHVFRVTFPSPVVTAVAVNNTVVGFLYEPQGPGPFPAMIVLHEWLPRNLDNEIQMAEAIGHAGVAAFIMEEPYSLERRPIPHRPDAELLSGNLPQMVAGLRQTVIDARRSIDFLQSRPEINPKKIGISGISLGGILAPLTAGVDHRLSVVLTVVGGADIADTIWNSLFTRGIQRGLVQHGYTFHDLEVAMAPFEADRWLRHFNPHNALMFNGSEDIFIRPWAARDLSKAMGGAPIVWLDTGHYGVVLSIGAVEKTGAEFLRSRFFSDAPPFQAPHFLPAHTIKIGILLGGQEIASPDLAYQIINFDRSGRYSLDGQLTFSGLSAALSAQLNDSKSIGVEFPLFHHGIHPRLFVLFHVVL